MKNKILLTSYTLAAMAGICFIQGLAFLTNGRS